MAEQDALLFVFVWLVPCGIVGLFEGFSEQFTYELDGCNPSLASWLRYGFLQYMLIFSAFVYLVYIPKKYSVYFERFLGDGAVAFFLSCIFVVMQILTPWVTLALYLTLKKNCNDRITQEQATFYWILFSLQVVMFLFGSIILYFFCDILGGIIDDQSYIKLRKIYVQEVNVILRSREHQRTSFAELLRKTSRYQSSLNPIDQDIFKMLLSRRIGSKSVEVLNKQHRVCFRCKFDFKTGERVHFMENCCHIAHWECFISCLLHNGLCSECKVYSVHQLKRSIINGPLQELDKLIAVPPSVKPTCQEQIRAQNALPAIPAPRPTITIEYFNYAIDGQKEQPAERVGEQIADTEIFQNFGILGRHTQTHSTARLIMCIEVTTRSVSLLLLLLLLLLVLLLLVLLICWSRLVCCRCSRVWLLWGVVRATTNRGWGS